MTTTYRIENYKANAAAIDKLCVEAGINGADVYRLDVHRWWVTFHTYRVSETGRHYVPRIERLKPNGQIATRRYRRWIR